MLRPSPSSRVPVLWVRHFGQTAIKATLLSSSSSTLRHDLFVVGSVLFVTLLRPAFPSSSARLARGLGRRLARAALPPETRHQTVAQIAQARVPAHHLHATGVRIVQLRLPATEVIDEDDEADEGEETGHEGEALVLERVAHVKRVH